MRVLHLIDSLQVGGAESIALNLVNALADEDLDIHLCATRKEGDLKNNLNNKVKYLFLNRKKTLDLTAFFKLKKYLKQNQIDIIHAHSTSSFIAFMMILMGCNCKVIWHNHTGAYTVLKGIKLWVLKLSSFYFDAIISVNKDLNSWAEKKLTAKNNYYLPNFASLDNQQKITILCGASQKIIVCLAGLRAEKDHLNLLRAFKIVLQELPDWSLHLVGKDYDDLYAQQVKDYIKIEHLMDKVFLLGICSDIKHILSQTTIGVLSSKSEGLPIALLEYGLAKLPVVCTDVGECSSVITHNFSGYMVPPQNPNELAFYLSKLAKSKEDLVRFGENLYLNIKENYSKEKAIKSVIKIYQKCLPIQNI